MTTVLHDAGHAVRAGRARTGGAPARRAVVRWAWRVYRREWRQQVLIVALLTVAVAATCFGVALAVNGSTIPQTTVELAGTSRAHEADIEALRARFGPVEVSEHATVTIPGSVTTVDVRAEPGDLSTLRLRSGRYPRGAGEVAVTPQVASLLGKGVGDVWQLDRQARQIVGEVENPHDLHDAFALVAPGQLTNPSSVSVLILSHPSDVSNLNLPGGGAKDVLITSSASEQALAAAIVLVLATIGLLFVGLVAVAGFALMAQRRLRALGMLGSLGATDRHVRLVFIADGAIVGATAAIIGAALGVVGWFAVAPRFATVVGHRFDRFALPWWAIGVAMVLAVLTAIGAAWWPARTAARTSVVTALSGRRPRPQPAHRFALLGVALLVIGPVLLVLANERHPLEVIGGTIATTIGMLLLAPLAVTVFGPLAARSTVAVRLALRDLARYQARSGAALGAVTLAIGIAATIVVSATAARATTASTTGGNLASNQLMVYLSSVGPDGGIAPVQTAERAGSAANQRTVDRIATAIGGSSVALEAAVNPHVATLPGVRFGEAGREPASLVKISQHGERFTEVRIGSLYVATPTVLAHFGIPASALDASTDVLSARKDIAAASVAFGPRNSFRPKVQHVSLPRYSSGPNALLTEHAVKSLGLQPVPWAWLVETRHSLTSAQISAARRVAASGGMTIETRNNQNSLDRLGIDATLGGIFVALAVLAMTVGLIRSETAGDMRTLTATGAARRTRRTITASIASALAVMGALLGTAGAYVALVAWHHHDLSPLGHVPVGKLALIVVGLPAVAFAVGWMFAGREPPAIARQALD